MKETSILPCIIVETSNSNQPISNLSRNYSSIIILNPIDSNSQVTTTRETIAKKHLIIMMLSAMTFSMESSQFISHNLLNCCCCLLLFL